MPTVAQTITIETRLPQDTAPESLAALRDYAELFSRASRHYLSHKGKPDELGKSAFMQTFGLTGRQYNAVKVSVEGMIQSQLSNLPNYVRQNRAKINGLVKRIEQKKRLVLRADRQQKKYLSEKYTGQIQGMIQRIDRLSAEIDDYEYRIKHKQHRICFGSRRLFKAQHHLEENGYADHAAWLADWRGHRSSQLFVLGSSDEAGGCQGCTLYPGDNGTYILRLRMPEALIHQHGQYLYLTDIVFPYRRDVVDEAMARNALRTQRKAAYVRDKKQKCLEVDPATGKPVSEAVYLKGLGDALSYRFMLDDKGVRVLISTDWQAQAVELDTAQGVLGVDFNADRVAVAELNGAGHKVKLEDIVYPYQHATSRQNKTQLQAIAKTIVSWAAQTHKPVILEDLDFSRKKGGLQKQAAGQADYHKMLSSLSYRTFKQAVIMQCLKQGVAWSLVTPEYTSLIGRLKYGRETQFNTHQAAAWVIGRRGMGLRETVVSYAPVRLFNAVRVYGTPEDVLRKGSLQNQYKALHQSFSSWIREAVKERRLRIKKMRQSLKWELLEPLPF